MPTKLNRVTINLTDEQLNALPVGRTKTERVMLALGFEAHERGMIMKTNNPRKTKKKSRKRKTT